MPQPCGKTLKNYKEGSIRSKGRNVLRALQTNHEKEESSIIEEVRNVLRAAMIDPKGR